MPAEAGVMTIEFKVNFLAPARAGSFRIVGRVRRAGRTVTFVEGEAIAIDGSERKTVATTQATMICLEGRAGIRHRAEAAPAETPLQTAATWPQPRLPGL
jgi:acyl-coenzyme A thioesterase PaaI-like protein